MASPENTVLAVETNTLETLFSAIKLNDYVSTTKSNKNKDISSLSSLVKRDLSQSDCIKLGTGLEKVLRDICSKSTKFKNIKPKNSKGKKEMDHLFISNNDTKKIIIYAEFKSNINLDTEKSKATNNKILSIINELKIKYPEYEVNGYLVSARYYDTKIIPSLFINKYENIKKNVIGINNYLQLFDQNTFTDEQHYFNWVNELANTMFEN